MYVFIQYQNIPVYYYQYRYTPEYITKLTRSHRQNNYCTMSVRYDTLYEYMGVDSNDYGTVHR